MEYGGGTLGGSPYAGQEISSSAFLIQGDLELIFPVSVLFFGEIGDVVFMPPSLDLGNPVNVSIRRSPCQQYDN